MHLHSTVWAWECGYMRKTAKALFKLHKVWVVRLLYCLLWLSSSWETWWGGVITIHDRLARGVFTVHDSTSVSMADCSTWAPYNCIKNSHEKWHRKCLNKMCVRSDDYMLHTQKTKRKRKVLWYHCCCKLLYHCSGHFHILWQPFVSAALFTSLRPDWILSTLDIQFSQLTQFSICQLVSLK